MRRKAILSCTMIGLILGLMSVGASRGMAVLPQARLQAVVLPGSASGDELLLRIEGGYSFRTVQATEETVLVDLKGVRTGSVARNGRWSGGLLSSYRLLQYTDATGQPVVRVQVEMRRAGRYMVRQEEAGLRLFFGRNPAASLSLPAATPALRAAPAVAVTKSLPMISARGSVEVSGVSIQSGAAGQTIVDIATSRATGYRVLRLTNPSRLVVDLEGAHNAAGRRTYPAQSPFLKAVRVGQFRDSSPAVARVVADLIGDPRFDVHAYSGGVRVELKSPSAASPVAVSEAPAIAEKVEPVQVAAANPSPVISAPSAEEAVASPPPQTPVGDAKTASPQAVAPSSFDLQNALPATAGSQEMTAAPKPEPPREAPEAVQAARAAMTLAGGPGALAAAPQGQAAGAVEEQPKYTGEPISLNLKDVDLKDFFRLIHEISGLNIIVDPNVTGGVTLVLDTVPWDQALDIVLKNNRLGKTLEGNVLRIARIETLTAEQEAAVKLAAAREEAQPLVTVFRPVNYAKAATIATMLKSWVGGGALSKRGNVLVDDRTNTLIISDIQTQIPVIESIITRLDKKAKQVQIEARIVRANADFSRNLAASLSAAYVNRSGSTITAGGTGTGSTANSAGELPLVTTQPVSGFGVYAISNAGARYLINAAIAMAETRSQAKTISRPSIVTQNNVPGTVLQGTQIPIQTTINNTISVQYVNATLTLRVTPQVTEDGNIFLDIQVTNATPGAIVAGLNPSINTQQATTQVLVPDGGTVVFGGVTVTTRSRSATQVPLLGSIPLIGNLFKTSTVQDADQELLFFVSPKVLPG